ncbi:MAG: PHP domain-containing protein, partial [Acholeplasmatales bacterium]|nr:PHP domain-containing protein [Acholeplasmatales bacterium]
KYSKRLELYLVLGYAVSYAKYTLLVETIKEILKPLNANLVIDIGYMDSTLTEEETLEYLEAILNTFNSESARFKSLNVADAIVNENEITFNVACDSLGLDELAYPLEKAFADYGFNIKVMIVKDEKKSIERDIKKLDNEIEEALEKQRQEALMAKKFNKEVREQKRNYKSAMPDVITSIKNIPVTQMALAEYVHQYGEATFRIKGYIFDKEIKEFPGKKNSLMLLKVTDETDSIVLQKWLRGDKEKEIYEKGMDINVEIDAYGLAVYDTYSKRLIIDAKEINVCGLHTEKEVKDNALEKRVELHCHTKMSTMDALTDATDYIKEVVKWGWKAMAFTDHNGVYAIPDIAHALAKIPDFKPIYGTELSYIEDDKYFITFNEKDINLRDAVYVVFDIETTGLSQTYDKIIEIAAHKVYQGGIISSYEVFVNPLCHIPEKITELTSITDEMVADAKTIDEVLPEFLDFCKDAILVAHNAMFDVGMIYRDMKLLGYQKIDFPVIDTLNLFRAGYYNEVKTFGLKALCKYFKVKQEHHHRAIDDTRVTALCFLQMLQDLYSKKIENYKDINSLIDPNVHFKHLIPYHITLLAKNPVGYKNMFKVLSDSMTYHMYDGDARCLKSILDKYREGILVGSSCVNGDVFENALNRSQLELEESISYYDYIEVQPPLAYKQLFVEMPDGEKRVQEIIQRIISTAKKMGKIVVATSDCHYLRPKLKKYRDILIDCPQIGGGTHPLSYALKKDSTPDMHLRTTEEMLSEFSFLDPDLAYEIVVTNTNLIADSIEMFSAFKPDMFAPRDDEFKDNFLHIESIEKETRRIV